MHTYLTFEQSPTGITRNRILSKAQLHCSVITHADTLADWLLSTKLCQATGDKYKNNNVGKQPGTQSICIRNRGLLSCGFPTAHLLLVLLSGCLILFGGYFKLSVHSLLSTLF